MTNTNRIKACFDALNAECRSGFVSFITAGDPTPDVSLQLMTALPKAGTDIIEIGIPFSDPMADGPAIQASSRRALSRGQTVRCTLELVQGFRQVDQRTPVVLFGYYNPILAYGVKRFSMDARNAGVDGLIVVDLPIEEMDELSEPASEAGLDIILLIAPTTDDNRLDSILERASGFVYSISVAGVTGTKSAQVDTVARQVRRIRKRTALPVAVGFGITTSKQAAAVAREADAVVVGSALVSTIGARVSQDGSPLPSLVPDTLSYVRSLTGAMQARDGEESGS